MLPLRADWNAARHFPPLLKTRTATTGTSVLCDKNGMASHWRLLPVVLRVGRCQPHANEILAMTADRIQALFRYVLPVRSRKAKAAPKLRSAESQKCRIKCTLVMHGRRYTFSTSRLISSTVDSVITLPIRVDIIPNSPSLGVVRVRRRRPHRTSRVRGQTPHGYRLSV